MRPLIPLSITCIAAACLVTGYIIGRKNAPQPAPSVIYKVDATPVVQAPAPAVPEVSIPAEPVQTAPAPVVASPAETAHFAARAKQTVITLTDTKERTLIGELVAATEHNLKVRRHADWRLLDVPVEMLCPEDQAFAAYLFEETKNSQQPKKGIQQAASISEADKIWDEIFKGM